MSRESNIALLLREQGISIARNDPLLKAVSRAVDENYIRGVLEFEAVDGAIVVRTMTSDGSMRILRIEARTEWTAKVEITPLLRIPAITMALLAGIKAVSLSSGVLRTAALLLPGDERADWIEEQKGYLSDLLSRRQKLFWIASQLMAMPRYVYTVRTGREKESA